MAIADAIANGDTETKLGTQTLKYTMVTIVLQDIYNEVLAMDCWHFRSTKTPDVPVLTDLLRFQHDTQLRRMLEKRDSGGSYWQFTTFSLAAYVNPPEDKSYWAAARRSLRLFDWIGHGRNLAKMELDPARKAKIGECRQCGEQDFQNH